MAAEKETRRPRRKRQPRGGFYLTEGDQGILRFLDEYGLLQAPHLSLLLPRSLRTTRRRLRELYHHNHVERLPKENPNQAEIYTPKGKTKKRILLKHSLLTADFMASLESSCRSNPDVRFLRLAEVLEQFAPEETKKERDPQSWRTKAGTNAGSLRPDSVFALRFTSHGKRGTALFFLETDRGTERHTHRSVKSDRKQTTIKSKFRRYLWTLENKVRQEPHPPFGLSEFRVLFVTSSAARIGNLLHHNRAITGGQGSRLFLFGTQDSFQISVDPRNRVRAENPLGTVWVNGCGEEVFLLG